MICIRRKGCVRIMTLAAIVVSAMVAPQKGMAGSCSAVDRSLAEINRDLGHNAADAADRLLLPIEKSHPDCAMLVLARARVHALRQEDGPAANEFDRYKDLAPEDANAYGYLANFLIDRGEYARADTLSSLGLDKDSANPAVLLARGRLLSLKGGSDAGREQLKRATQLDPDYADAQYQMGLLEDGAKRKAEAAQHFKIATDLDPHYATAWDYLALDLEAAGEVDGLDQIYRKGLDSNVAGPHHDAFLNYNYGRYLMKRGDLEASKLHLDLAVKEVAEVRAVWYERSRLEVRMKNYQQAKIDAETAANIPDEDGVIIDLQIYSLLAQVYRRLGETALADKYAQLSRDTPAPIPKEYR